jgi:uncharacterized membrane protein
MNYFLLEILSNTNSVQKESLYMVLIVRFINYHSSMNHHSQSSTFAYAHTVGYILFISNSNLWFQLLLSFSLQGSRFKAKHK